MKSEEQQVKNMEETRRQEAATKQAAHEAAAQAFIPMPPGQLGAPYSELWGYFHLAPARQDLEEGPWATCRLCGEQVSRGWSFHASTPELWKHLKNVHQRDLEKSGSRLSQPSPPCPPSQQPLPPQSPLPQAQPGPAGLTAEGEWARLLEQMSSLVLRCSLREQELARREAAVEQAERALELHRRALQAEECAADAARRELQADRDLLQARLREVSRRECALGLAADPKRGTFKEEPESEEDSYLITKVFQ